MFAVQTTPVIGTLFSRLAGGVMPDRVIRDELLESDRFLGLPTDTDRLAFIGLRLRSDDFGNIEGGLRRLSRLLQSFTHIKTDEAAATTLLHLCDADLIRRYESGGREFYHLPRGRPTGSYLVRKCPPSPWCDPEVKLGKHVRAVRNQGLAKNVPVTSLERNPVVSQGVGVGIGIGEVQHLRVAPKALPVMTKEPKEKSRATRLPNTWRIPDEWVDWAVQVYHEDRARIIRLSLEFRDYWIAVPGAKGRKLDWLATWRNRCRQVFDND